MRILKIINMSTLGLKDDGTVDDVIQEIQLADNDSVKVKNNELIITTKYAIDGCAISIDEQ